MIIFVVVYGLRRRKPVRTHLVREHQSPHRSPNDAPVDNGTNVAEEVENETPPSSPNELPDEDVERCDPPAFMDIEDEFDGPPPVSRFSNLDLFSATRATSRGRSPAIFIQYFDETFSLIHAERDKTSMFSGAAPSARFRGLSLSSF